MFPDDGRLCESEDGRFYGIICQVKLSLSTNWCNRRLETGEEIAEKALELGFSELELGYHTTLLQADGFKRMRERIPVGSIHAFCPVPLSAPQGYPELYSLANFDEDGRALARVHVLKNIRFAAEMGADTVVLHAGRVSFGSFFSRLDSGALSEILREAEKKTDDKKYVKRLAKARTVRTKRGLKMLDLFRAELEKIVPEIQKQGVTLALENMPYYEGFPLKGEMDAILDWGFGDCVKAWYDTGHARVCACHGWTDAVTGGHDGDGRDGEGAAFGCLASLGCFATRVAGMHLNDVKDLNDDHLAPGFGNVDFAALKPLAESVRHVVFEPNAGVSEEDLRRGVENIRRIWALS